MQESNRTFFNDFALRISFMRQKRGLGLAELSGGAASTAKSWESGSRPRPAQWDEVAAKLGLSVSFVFVGKPTSGEDYAFIAKYADELPPYKPEKDPLVLNEDSARYTSSASATHGKAEVIELRALFESVVAEAQKRPGGIFNLTRVLRRYQKEYLVDDEVSAAALKTFEALSRQARENIAARKAGSGEQREAS